MREALKLPKFSLIATVYEAGIWAPGMTNRVAGPGAS